MFTSDAGAQTSYDTYNPGVIDLTDDDNAIEDIEDNSVIDLRQGSDSSSDILSGMFLMSLSHLIMIVGCSGRD